MSERAGIIIYSFIVLILFVALGVGVYLVQQRQIFREKAATPPPNPCEGQTDGSSCSICPDCVYAVPRCLAPCQVGTCQNQTCAAPTPTPTPNPCGPTCGTPLPNPCEGLADGTSCTGGGCPAPLIGPGGRPIPCTRPVFFGVCQNQVCVPGTPTPAPLPYIQVNSPNGGETLLIGQPYTIRWQASGITSYLIYLVNYSGQASLINGIAAPNTSYNWIVNTPFVPRDGLYKIRIMDASGGGFGGIQGESNTFFNIVSPTPTPTPTPTSIALGTGTLNFQIKFEGINSQKPDQFVRIGLKNSQTFDNIKVISNPSGIYSGVVSGIAPGTYEVLVKGPKHLQKNFGSVTFNPDQTVSEDWSQTPLLAGDLDGNNLVNAVDIAKVIQDYFPNTPAGAISDFNLDGTVNAVDIGFVIENYFKEGDK